MTIRSFVLNRKPQQRRDSQSQTNNVNGQSGRKRRKNAYTFTQLWFVCKNILSVLFWSLHALALHREHKFLCIQRITQTTKQRTDGFVHGDVQPVYDSPGLRLKCANYCASPEAFREFGRQRLQCDRSQRRMPNIIEIWMWTTTHLS